MQFMTETNQFNHNLHAYQRYLGTSSTLLQLNDSIFSVTDDNMVSAIMSIDESATFDCISMEILIEKLKLYNFGEDSLKWISSYLKNHTQYVTINTKGL